ncbi:site-specific integrase [Rufibacter latericius]|uniref:Uncharacterized protein n=1 Tax=Rufibacter latericius TaxID=2487040 RepID=A0A3M9M928_9BACT|nr:hypothetical protein [Rufibacter latericius]RNI22052.1 hypothetical protein EFB08_23250 [Rufibacter latericius]
MIDKYGNEVWHLYQVKGRNPEPVDVPLMKEALVIMRRQKRKSNSPLVFDRISDVKYNKYIKEVCQLAGFNDLW